MNYNNNNTAMKWIGHIILFLGIVCLIATAYAADWEAFAPSVFLCCIGFIAEELSKPIPLCDDDENPIVAAEPTRLDEWPTEADFKRNRRVKNRILARWALRGHPVSNLRFSSALQSIGVPRVVHPRDVETAKKNRHEWERTINYFTPRPWKNW